MVPALAILLSFASLVPVTPPAPGDAPFDGNGALGFLERHVGKVNFVTAETFAVASGTLTLTGLPPGAVIRKAWFYYHGWASAGFPQSVSFAGHPLPIIQIGRQNGHAGARVVFRTFRNDVTAYVTGNGTYPWATPTQARGGALLVIYEDSTLAADYDIEIHDGAHGGTSSDGAECPWPNPVNFTGFTVNGVSPREVEVAVLTEGGAPTHSESFHFMVSTLETSPFTGIATNPANDQYEWDRYDVSMFYAGGETTGYLWACEGTDAICWQSAVLRVRTTSPITDTTPPEICCAIPGDGSVVASSPMSLMVTVRDESATTITSVPPAAWDPSSFPMPTEGQTTALFNLVEGPNSITVTATDAYGLSSSKTVTVILDTLLPQVTITTPADGAVIGAGSVQLTATVSDATATDVISNPTGILTILPAGGGMADGTVALVEGPNTLAVTATDAAGHTGGTSISVIRDTIAPVVVVTSPVEGAVLGDSPALLSLIVTDATATTVTFGGNTASLPPGGGSVTGEVALQEGGNVVLVTATDAAGNATTVPVTVVLDLTAPLVTIDAPSSGACFGPGESPVAVMATVDDLTATTVSSEPTGIAGALPAGGGIVTGAVSLTEGHNTITVSATDGAGRTGSASISVILDTTPAVVAVTSPADGSAVRGGIDFHASAADPLPGSGIARLDFLVDGNLAASAAAPPFETDLDTSVLADGLHVLAARAVDGKGNEATASITVRVDNTPPAVAIDAPLPGPVVGGAVAFTASASDGGSGLSLVELRAGGLASTTDASVTYDPPVFSDVRAGQEDTARWPDGTLVFSARARDLAGNETTALITVTVDNTAPEKCLLAPADGSTVSGTLLIQAAASDPNLASLEILADGVSLGTSASSTYSVALDTTSRLDGTLTITAVARDLAGNTSACTATVTVDNASFRLTPRTLNLRSQGGPNSVTAHLEGLNLALLMPTEAHALELRVPGGNPVPSTTGFAGDDVTSDSDGDTIPELGIKFDRQTLIASIRAGIAAGFLQPDGLVTVTLVAEGTRIIGTDTIRIVGG